MPEPIRVDLEPGEEEEEPETEEREDLGRHVDPEPVEPGGADEDAERDLEDDRRHPQRRCQLHEQWRDESDDRDDEDGVVAEVVHARQSDARSTVSPTSCPWDSSRLWPSGSRIIPQ